MPATLARQERVLRNQRVGILRLIDEHSLDLETASEWMRGQVADLMLHDPMLITVRKDKPVLTDAGRDYLAAVDPVPSS